MTDPILVLGGGPAGGAVALGLAKLGFTVAVVATPRPFRAMEGVSERVVEGLRNVGFRYALEALPAPTPRMASWSGTVATANTERLVDREQLDAGILQDLQAAGIRVITGRVSKVEEHNHGFDVYLKGQSESLTTPFLVEARGRSAPSSSLPRKRGPETVSLLQYWQGAPIAPCSAAVSFTEGWAWMAAGADGTRYLQLTFDVASKTLPEKSLLVAHCNQILLSLPQAQHFTQGAEPTGELHARTSTPILCEQAVGERWIRVGDAAMAVDPLSGNGIFQSLSSALQAPAVINTLINKPENAALAQQFYQQRVDHLFHRFARIGRDFYALEAQWPTQPFWQHRAGWPDTAPLHQITDPSSIEVMMMPVVKGGFIELAEVVTTNDQPLGIWHLNGQPLVPIANALAQRQPHESPESCFMRTLNMPERQAVQWSIWVQQNGWVASDD